MVCKFGQRSITIFQTDMVAINYKTVFNRPSPAVLMWCRQLVATRKNGDTWHIPRSNTVFRINKNQQQLELIKRGDTYDDFYATRHNFAFIAWDVVDMTQNDKNTSRN